MSQQINNPCIGTKKLVLGGAIMSAAAVALWNTRRTIPKGVKAVKPFFKEKYLGKWYEIARMNYLFEKNLDHTTAEYSENPDGSIHVLNKGFDFKKKSWKKATGRAIFKKNPNKGSLKVSFFGPFYEGYNIIDIDPDYQYALIAGRNLKYLWILSRDKTIPTYVKERFLRKARESGYDTDKLVWVNQD